MRVWQRSDIGRNVSRLVKITIRINLSNLGIFVIYSIAKNYTHRVFIDGLAYLVFRLNVIDSV